MRRTPPGQSPPTVPDDIVPKRRAVMDIVRRCQGVMDTDVEAALSDVRGILAGLDKPTREESPSAGQNRMETGGTTRATRKRKTTPGEE